MKRKTQKKFMAIMAGVMAAVLVLGLVSGTIMYFI